MSASTMKKHLPALWGGFECTVSRIGDKYRDQARETGHDRRDADIDRAADLGITALRYGVLWDRAPDDDSATFWKRHDRRLARISNRGLETICGLTHHGSGPVHANILDPNYPVALAAYARRVAERYPHISTYTPVNEPLTTARFCCLYGHWHPHKAAEKPFLRALFHECFGIALSMREIRKVNSAARLVQTEDLGRVFSTPQLAYQADYENERRWLSFDLLSGRVIRGHPFYQALVDSGVCEADLNELADRPCRPDVFGINHYLSSDRFLDDRIDDYPSEPVGGNRVKYVDLLAARADVPLHLRGPKARLSEVVERYNAPVAITEIHNGSSRDEQLRWFHEVWTGACELATQGVDVRAVTLWALAGVVDWASLLTRTDGVYEPGAFDIRCEPPRATAIARAARDIATTGSFDHPCLDGLGWWKRNNRFDRDDAQAVEARPWGPIRKLYITDLHSPLGVALRVACSNRDLAIASAKDDNIWAIIDSREDPDDTAAKMCLSMGLPLVAFSTNRVFAPHPSHQYTESESPQAATSFGRRARDAEESALIAPATLLVRTGPRFSTDWADPQAIALKTKTRLSRSTLTYLPDLAENVLDLLIDQSWGIWHLVNRTSAEQSVPTEDMDSSIVHLGTERGVVLPAIVDGWSAIAAFD